MVWPSFHFVGEEDLLADHARRALGEERGELRVDARGDGRAVRGEACTMSMSLA
jgi:hypothetical protein